jgi:hypothetical protein
MSSPFIHLEPQSDFPASDLTDDNDDILVHVLSDEAGVESHAIYLQQYQRALYETAHMALLYCDYPAENSFDEYQAFTRGFATFETISSLVRPGVYDTSFAALRAQWMLMAPGEFTDVELAKRTKSWPDERPNTHGAVITIGEKRGESMNQLRSRAIGAQIAFELQRPILDAA